MADERKYQIAQAVERAVSSVASGQTSIGTGGLFELAYPFAAAEVPDATPEEIIEEFATLWGVATDARALYLQVLAVCDRHNPQQDETIKNVLQRASSGGDLEAAFLLNFTNF